MHMPPSRNTVHLDPPYRRAIFRSMSSSKGICELWVWLLYRYRPPLVVQEVPRQALESASLGGVRSSREGLFFIDFAATVKNGLNDIILVSRKRSGRE